MDGEHDDQNNSVTGLVNNEGPPIRKIFVGNLSDRTTYCDLRRLFSCYGKVVDAHVSRDKVTQAKKKFGFVTFKYPEDASSVLKLKQRELRLHLRNLYVAPADSWHQPVQLPDGTVLWKSNSHGGWKHHHHSVKELNSLEPQTHGVATETSSGSESASGDEKDIGAVGGCDLPFHISNCVRVQQQLEGEREIDGEGREVEAGQCNIHILNNDCLMHIFSFLTKTERIRIERVCKRWQMVCLDMWVCQKHLDFSSLPSSSSVSYLTMPILGAFLKRCGRNLHSLDLSHKPHELNSGVLQTIVV